MPNYAENFLTIHNPNANKEIEPFMTGCDIDFNKIIPAPFWIDSKLDDEWCYENWGTKWSATDTRVIQQRKQSLSISFLTPWGPPTPILERLSTILDSKMDIASFVFEFGMAERGYLLSGTFYKTDDDFEGLVKEFYGESYYQDMFS